ncbi:Rpn family recombination-promoting nuclease/putative transposase [Priestia megaterium]|uniref:Rpn family recombination-promoting nuclease/putative transposase n=1 Tax=Priestia TaxID=2800373 RepID=UPI000D3EA37A|nr:MULTISPECIES: Rpn family recombination-promoting nuclease/putative transposase [Priestia]AWD68649.1 ATPase [Priestia megaterium]MED4002231.1 Rpn family recombination-promoting nuclease/putative transposase [Priestia aryabhattai]MED5121624.1 Rpn family recombination-promoting nuclease/putative transposase [Priestia megaterium]QFY76091.1 ATPase [Priestia megaterium]
MSTKLVNLRIDFAFKQLFGTKGSEDILAGFLNAVLEKSLEAPITSLQLEDPHLHKAYEDDKLSILDLLATLNNGTQVNIEIQLRNTHDMVKRSLYYWSKLYTSQMQEGMPYRALRKTITINLLDFILFSSDEEFQTTGQLWDTTKQRVLSDDIEIHFVEIPKLVKQWRQEKVNPWENAFVRWILLLPAHEDEHLTQTLEEIAMNQDPILQKAMDKWENMSHDSSFRSAYEAREKLLLDEQAKLAHAREEGLEEGKIRLIRSMHENGMPLDDIAKFTGLNIEEIKRVIR